MITPLTRVPVDIGRDEAANAAARELSRAVYQPGQEPLLTRVGRWLLAQLVRLVERVGDFSPGGYVGLLIILVVVLAVVVLVRMRTGPLAARSHHEPLLAGSVRTAAEHRAAADRFAAAGDWAQAIRERMRAVARELEEQGTLEPRPGRTADELARDAAVLLPAVAEGLSAAVRIFDEVWYGERPADVGAYQVVVAADRQTVQVARP